MRYKNAIEIESGQNEEEASITFTNKPEYYTIGNTIVIHLLDGTKATYELTSIK